MVHDAKVIQILPSFSAGFCEDHGRERSGQGSTFLLEMAPMWAKRPMLLIIDFCPA